MSRRRRCVVLLLTLLAAGCSDRPQPSLRAPIASAYPAVPAHGTGKASGRVDAPAARRAWWKAYGDAELDALVARSLERHPRLAAVAAAVAESRAHAAAAGAEYRPQLDASASARRFRDSEREVLPSDGRAHSRFVVGVGASWEIDLWGRGRRQREQAVAQAEADGLAAAMARVVLAAEVVDAYIGLRAAQRRLALARRIDACHRRAVAIAQGRVALGAGIPSDVAEAEAAWHADAAVLPALVADEACATYRLCALTGEAPAARITTATKGANNGKAAQDALARIPGLPRPLVVGIPADLLRTRPDIRRSEREVAVATAAVGVADADRFPRLALDGSIALAALRLADLASPAALAWVAGPALGWSLLDGGRRDAAVTAAEARVAAAIANWRERVLEAQREVAEAMARVAAAEGELEALRAAERAASQAWRDEEQRLALGATDARAPVARALVALRLQDRVAITEQRRAAATVTLAKALGNGW